MPVGMAVQRPPPVNISACSETSYHSEQSTVASTPDLPPRRRIRVPTLSAIPHAARSQRPTRAAWLLVALVTLALAKLLAGRFALPADVQQLVVGMLDSRSTGRPLTITRLLEAFEETGQYLRAAAWHREGKAYAPDTSVTEGAVERRSIMSVSVPAGMSCNGVTEVQHITVRLPDVSPIYVMDVLLSPEYGSGWNPNIQGIKLSKAIAVEDETEIPLAMMAAIANNSVMDNKKGSPAKADGRWSVVGQVIEVPLPTAVKRLAGGPRYSADWIVSRFVCPAQLGFVLSTSHKTELLEELANVQAGQEMCLSAILMAPLGENGTVVHWMQHLDPNSPSALRRAVLTAVGAATRRTIDALGRKARAVQQSGVPPRLTCA